VNEVRLPQQLFDVEIAWWMLCPTAAAAVGYSSGSHYLSWGQKIKI